MAVAARRLIPHGESLSRPHLPQLTVRRLGVASAAVFLLLLIDALLHSRAFFDLSLMTTIQAIDPPGQRGAIDTVGDLTSSTGAVAMWIIVIVAFMLARWWVALLGAMTLPLGGIANYVFGELLVARTRPHVEELERTSRNFEERSFPSGHVMGAVMLYGFVFVVARRVHSRILRFAIQGASLAIIASVGFARVWTGAHWPTDVLAAYALGGAMLAGMVALHGRLDAEVGRLPLIRAAAISHDENRPHAHALTSLVTFEGDRVAKTYAPGLIPTALYWLAFQAPFPYVRNQTALDAAVHRRNLARLLTIYWYGSPRVARAHGTRRSGNRTELMSERIVGHRPTDRKAAKAFLRDLRARFEAAGLPTWQIDARQPRAVDNLLEAEDGRYYVVDLESGLVSPLASLRTWSRAIKRGLVPFFDDIFFDVTRAYITREAIAIQTALGQKGYAELRSTLDAAEQQTASWHHGEPRIWGRLLRAVLSGFHVRSWKARTQARLEDGRERGLAWIDRAIAVWETEGRITGDEAATLRYQVEAPTFQAMLPYLGAHILVSIPLRFPLGSIARSMMVLGALLTATGRLFARKIDRDTWRAAWTMHSPLVLMIAAVPGFGTFAYLAAKPVRSNRLLLRTLADAALQKVPWNMYERSHLRRFVVRPGHAVENVAWSSPAALALDPEAATLSSS